MNSYTRGTPINLVEKFRKIDPITEVATLADPTTVTFRILSPDDVEQVFVFGVSPNVTHPSVGVYVCALDPQLPTGTYTYRCDGTGAVVATSEGIFDVVPSAVLEPDPPGVAQPGPCSAWIEGADVLNFSSTAIDGVTDDTAWKLDDVAFVACDLLYSLTGRQFPGVCERTVRPTRDLCGCDFASGVGWYWASSWAGGTWGWYWWAEGAERRLGCGSESVIRLAGYPVRKILEVKIDGVPVPELDGGGNPNWRLDGRRWLSRMDDPGPPFEARRWPACQHVSLDDTESGTFSIRYTWGAEIPLIGRLAACQLARELWKAINGGQCALPSKVTKVVRSGVTLERVVALADMFRSGSTGLQLVDAFIADYNPTKRRMRSAVWSPDVKRYPPKVGQD